MPSKQTWKSKFLEKLQKLFNGERQMVKDTSQLRWKAISLHALLNTAIVRRSGEWVERDMSFLLAFSFVIQLLASPELQISKDDSQD